ncbi:FecR family protein [Filimonas lacunae]|uniref:FecR family protein n=1 Tax=Filimonas lacunae TaxID=477680 RepID=A0A173MAI2_9BACT|nr:FecR family protein [Filimonas lacunae]BAV04542.1 anti-sigma factor [Filimonas lacunae]SIT31751.1 FecR family protein [Filimonas lacunae]
MLPVNPTELLKLVKKYQEGTATPAEKDFIEQYYQHFHTQEKASAQWNNDHKQQLENNLLQRINLQIEQESTPVVPVVPLYKRSLFKIAAAVLLLATGTAIYIASQHTDNKHTATAQQDVAPGGNKATLTLADGSVIVLDNAGNGKLTSQNNFSVIKASDGKIAYQQDSVASALVMQYNLLSTPLGGRYQVTLSDGTTVWLNSSSSLRYPTAFNGATREVELTGEGYFEVARNSAKPFHVIVPVKRAGERKMDVKVLGTHFNINAYEEEQQVNTTLLEGSVVVGIGSQSKCIAPGQAAALDLYSQQLLVKNADTEGAVAWKNGRFAFHHQNIKEVMRQIARWYNVEIVYEGKISDEDFGGEIPCSENLSKVLKMLELTGIVHFRLEDRKVIVKP